MSSSNLTKAFIEKARIRQGDRYSYDKVIYVKRKMAVIISCKIHGDFLQTPCAHLSGCGCTQCGIIASHLSRHEEAKNGFKERSRIAHNGRYNYDKAVYTRADTKVEIVCSKHGSFWQIPSDHIRGIGCHKCGDEVRTISTIKGNIKDFISEAVNVHSGKYSYGNSEFKGSHVKIQITCKHHGNFWQTPFLHLEGQGCFTCSRQLIVTKLSETFVDRCKKVHGENKYDYSLTKYTGRIKKVKIICKIHGEFLQKADCHLRGHGCPKCSMSGFKKHKPAYLYILETTDGFVGFGISADLSKRLATHKRNLKIGNVEIIRKHIFKGSGDEVFNTELYIKQNFANIGTQIEGFKTEAFTEDRLKSVLEYIRSSTNLS